MHIMLIPNYMPKANKNEQYVPGSNVYRVNRDVKLTSAVLNSEACRLCAELHNNVGR